VNTWEVGREGRREGRRKRRLEGGMRREREKREGKNK